MSNEEARNELKEEFFIEAVDAFGDGKLDEAVEHYRKALEIDPRYQDALHGLARLSSTTETPTA